MNISVIDDLQNFCIIYRYRKFRRENNLRKYVWNYLSQTYQFEIVKVARFLTPVLVIKLTRLLGDSTMIQHQDLNYLGHDRKYSNFFNIKNSYATMIEKAKAKSSIFL